MLFNFLVNVYNPAMTSPASSARRAPKKASPAAPTPRETRHQALADARRELILDAARSAFSELGMEKTSIREIALRAGYTPGAIYSYFASKEALYGALLGESLERLNHCVDAACARHGAGVRQLQASAQAFFDFYLENPRDLDLGFYLFQGVKPRGLTPELNETLNARLRDALRPVQESLQALGLSEAAAISEVTALFAHAVGLLVLNHTGRIKMFKRTSPELFLLYLRQLIERASQG